MPRKLEVNSQFYQEDFLLQARSSTDKRHYRRLLGLHHIQSGQTQSTVSRLLGVTLNSVQKWIKRYKQQGIEGLKPKAIPGRTSRLNKDQLHTFVQAFIAQQEALPGGRLTGKDAQKMLKKDYGCDYNISTVYQLLHSCGLSWITGRSRHPLSCSKKQEAFKKTLEHQ